MSQSFDPPTDQQATISGMSRMTREAVEIGLAVTGQRHLHQHGGDRRYRAHGDRGMIAGDDAGLFQLAQPRPARRRRQADLVGQRQLGDAPVALDGVKDFEIDRIEC